MLNEKDFLKIRNSNKEEPFFGKVYFVRVEEIWEKSKKVFETEKALLKSIFPEADIQHVGGTSIPGSVTKGDIDIQIRIESNKFQEVVFIMKNKFLPINSNIWNDEFAIFAKRTMNKGKIEDVDYMITVINSPYDDFYKVRDFLKLHPDLLNEYNEIKKTHEGKSYDEYRKSKKDFLGRNGAIRFF